MTSPNQIIKEVADKFDISTRDIIGPKRHEWFVRARRETVKRMKNELNLSFTEMGIFLNRDHTSIIYLYETKGRENKNWISKYGKKTSNPSN